MTTYLVVDSTVDNNPIGGAEQVNDFIKKSLNIPMILTRDLVPDPNDKYIITSPYGLNQIVINSLPYMRYIIVEHDYKFVANRNPWVFKDAIVPPNQRQMIEYYASADTIYCQTNQHMNVFKSNRIPGHYKSFNSSLWSQEDLVTLATLDHKYPLKAPPWVIYDHIYPQKNTAGAVKFCQEHCIPYTTIKHTEERIDFLEQIARFSTFVFFPTTPESCCRIVVEAKCMNVNVMTTMDYGASSATWFNETGEALRKLLEANTNTNIESLKEFTC